MIMHRTNQPHGVAESLRNASHGPALPDEVRLPSSEAAAGGVANGARAGASQPFIARSGRRTSRLPRFGLGVLLLTLGWPGAAAPLRTQSIALHAGWNAVFLEVDPTSTEPVTLFAGTPIEIATTYYPNRTPVQYLKDPREAPWKEPGWNVWYAPARAEAPVTDLFAIHGHRAYLLYAARDFTWNVTGLAGVCQVRWQPDSFNLLGFPVDPGSPPTMTAFFSGSAAHRGQPIYRLEQDRWIRVTDPEHTPLEPGRAYWIFSRGGSSYQGPVDARLPIGGALDFGTTGGRLSLEFVNHLAAPVSVTVEDPQSSGVVPLSYVIRNHATLETAYPRLPAALTLPPVAGGDSAVLTLQVRREAMTAAYQEGLLTVTTDAGTRFWVPVSARRSDLAIQP